MAPITVAAVHAAPEYLDVDRTIEKACGLIIEAGEQGADLIVFPEVFVPGFPYWINCYAPLVQVPMHARYANTSIDMSDAASLRPVQEAARRAETMVVLGINEREGGSLYNAQVFIDERGNIIGRHRKLQLTFAERTLWAQGDGSTLNVFDTKVGRLGGLICWEHTMNLARQALVGLGEQIHASSWPGLSTLAGFSDTFDDQVEAMTRNHALTSQSFVVVAQNPVNQQVLDVLEAALGPQEFLTTGGGWSAIIHPMTPYLAGPHTGLEEKILYATIDLEDITGVKMFVDSNGHYARGDILRLSVDDRAAVSVSRTSGNGVVPMVSGDPDFVE
ncbi:carbon-nitrogen hydrolase family protein [Aeromicrobium wangtongii]|uniref:Carbon-nitrogen hydrolase family protein n=1 Tax=Aeromicrobium wangtongii TaxID=2969247 RepID=A0ABY5M2I7_9ACTN|nr:carbon-nitrogen hydrolase family protein [Aeromicrobium wangtongii]MCD9198025.1 carbon-nitrogen hydrolase family protein [Aeromicrobium wangtongii]UUP12067.1 carbon-nitrogen hydrolase family protein [Aeromicrobium wangtongii]